MKPKNIVIEQMLEKYNSSKEEHEKVHLWTLALMTAGLIDRKSKNKSSFSTHVKVPDIKTLL